MKPTHDEFGREIPDPNPVEMPLGFKKPLSIHEQIQRALRTQRIMEAQQSRGEETLEDSMDFDTGDDEGLPVTQHEVRDMQEELVAKGAEEHARAERVEKLKAARSKKGAESVPPVDAGEQEANQDERKGKEKPSE